MNSKPAATCRNPVAAVTWTGASRSLVLPSPSCPSPFAPQHHRVPSALRAQVWYSPTETSTISAPKPATWVGVAPPFLQPQHQSVPSVLSAQVTCMPAETLDTAWPSAVTSTGVDLSTNEPSPSSPEVFMPQHQSEPSILRAQEWYWATEMPATSDPSAVTWVGVLWPFHPVPSPRLPNPQHQSVPSCLIAQV